MTVLPIMLFVWALCLMIFIALIIYRSQLTRHEVDQVFLNENVDQSIELEHDDIVRRVDSIDPYLKTAGGATALITVAVIGVYVAEILPTVKF
jgi:hypothetical protein